MQHSIFYRFTNFWLLMVALLLRCAIVHAGDFAPQVDLQCDQLTSPGCDTQGTTAIRADSNDIVAWATAYSGYAAAASGSGCDRGSNLTAQFSTPEKALGAAGNSDGNQEGFTLDIVSLGRGGCITLEFDTPIANGEGWDFAVFENGFYVSSPSQGFLELARVEVSSDGATFFEFEAITQGLFPVGGFSNVMDASDYDGFAGKFVAGYGVPFDLSNLPDDAALNKQAITHVRLRDVIGNGTYFDDSTPPRPVYDPFATVSSAGFDLDAVAVRNQSSAEPFNVPLPSPFLFILAALLSLAQGHKATRGSATTN